MERSKKVVCINSLGEVCVNGVGLGGTDVLDYNEIDAHPQKDLIEKVWELQEYNDWFMRVWYNGKKILISVEFCQFDDMKDWWKQLRILVKKAKGKLWVMDKRKNRDKWKNEGDKDWTTGPDHGRPETQVSVDWEVKNPPDVIRIRSRVEKVFKTLFEDVVSVS